MRSSKTIPSTNLQSAFFPVELRPVFTGNDPSQTGGHEFRRLERHRAVIDCETGHPFAVVTRDYQLVTNEMAYELGQVLMHRVFKTLTSNDLECFNIVMPKSRSFCQIDLIQKGASFEPWKDDKWIAFLRITNSYNRTRRLRYEIGFCRWICRNGVVFGQRSVEFSYDHSRGALDKIQHAADQIGNIRKIEAEVVGHLHALKSRAVDPADILALACKAFEVRWPADKRATPRQLEEAVGFREQIQDGAEGYFQTMGHNAYAALNVLTDYASRPTGMISPETRAPLLQRRAGQWAESFLQQSAQPGFDMKQYLGSANEVAERLASLEQV